MDINQLRAFQAVARTGSVTTAADKLFRAPSSITTRIHQLEQEFDQPLFLRVKNRLKLAPAGEILLEQVDQLLPMFDQIEHRMRESQEIEHISLGALDVALDTYLPNAIGQVRELYPKARLFVRQAPSEVLRDELINKRLDIVLNDGPIEVTGIVSQYAFSEKLVLVTDKHQPDITSSKDLEGVDIYGFQRNCSYRLKLDKWLKAGGIEAPNIIEMESYNVILACVSGGAGAAWIPESCLKDMANKNAIKAHDLGEAGRTDLYFSWWESKDSSLLQSLIENVANSTHVN